MTKKDNKQINKRRIRRALNKAVDFFSKVSGGRLNSQRWGRGVAPSEVKERDHDDR